MKTNEIRIGVLGCGWIMRSIYTPTLLSLRDKIHVTAICDINEDAARGTALGHFADAKVFTDPGTMLQTGNMDAVMVLTTEKVNAAMAQLVLKSGRPVYLEKPPAVSLRQLEELITAEKNSESFVYTAFNRRHTPFFANIDFGGGKVRRVSGALRRLKRVVATFPHTSIHLIDSAQFFGKSLFQDWKIDFKHKPDHSIWTVKGKTESGGEFSLEFIPDGTEFAEYLVFETDDSRWELQFPNNDAIPEGEIIVSTKGGLPGTRTRGDKALAPFQSMGFQQCLLDFVERFKIGKASPMHNLSSCRATIRLVEEMEACVKG